MLQVVSGSTPRRPKIFGAFEGQTCRSTDSLQVLTRMELGSSCYPVVLITHLRNVETFRSLHFEIYTLLD